MSKEDTAVMKKVVSVIVLHLAMVVTVLPKPGISDVVDPLRHLGWQVMTFNNKAPNTFSVLPDGSIEVSSTNSVSLISKPVTIDLANQPILSWRWRVITSAPATDLSIRGSDDRSLAVYVGFPFVPDDASWIETIRRKAVEAALGDDIPWRVLVYVWGGIGERGDQVASPHMGEAAMMKILRPGSTPTEKWFAEQVDIAEDYRRAFGSEPVSPLYVAISADTDDTASVAQGVVSDLGFHGDQVIN